MINILNLVFDYDNYKDLQKQILKIHEETKEIELAFLHNKFGDGRFKKIGKETFDLIQTCLTLLNNNFTDEEIIELEIEHNMKIKERLDK